MNARTVLENVPSRLFSNCGTVLTAAAAIYSAQYLFRRRVAAHRHFEASQTFHCGFRAEDRDNDPINVEAVTFDQVLEIAQTLGIQDPEGCDEDLFSRVWPEVIWPQPAVGWVRVVVGDRDDNKCTLMRFQNCKTREIRWVHPDVAAAALAIGREASRRRNTRKARVDRCFDSHATHRIDESVTEGEPVAWKVETVDGDEVFKKFVDVENEHEVQRRKQIEELFLAGDSMSSATLFRRCSGVETLSLDSSLRSRATAPGTMASIRGTLTGVLRATSSIATRPPPMPNSS